MHKEQNKLILYKTEQVLYCNINLFEALCSEAVGKSKRLRTLDSIIAAKEFICSAMKEHNDGAHLRRKCLVRAPRSLSVRPPAHNNACSIFNHAASKAPTHLLL